MRRKHRLIFAILAAFVLLTASGYCALNVDEARGLVKSSQDYYERAVKAYLKLISGGNADDAVKFELGKLYYSHGDYTDALAQFKSASLSEAKKFMALSFYHLADFTDAFDIFERNEINDNEYRYYYGLTCEKLNLFDRALDVYKKITSGEFDRLAQQRVDIIERQSKGVNIKDLDPKIDKIIKCAPPEEKFPEAGALILKAEESYAVTSSDTEISDMHYVIKILNDRGKEDFSESHIEYDSTFEKVELIFARAIKPDGSVVDVGTRHIRDVSKYLNFPLYSNARVFIISFPEIARGSCIEYRVKIYRSQLINKKSFVLNYPVQSSEPVVSADFSVEVPNDRQVDIEYLNENYNTFGSQLKPVKKEGKSATVYSWSFKDIPQIIPESNMPAAVEINPTMIISAFSSWGQIYEWWWGLAKDKIKADQAIVDKVKELVSGLKTDEEKVRSIYNYCARNIRYVAVEYGQAGYEPHKAQDIFSNKYGDCKDQAVLLVTMLRQAGFEAWPVLISTKEYYDLKPDFPSMLFNHCIAALPLAGRIVFMDPTAQTCSFDDLPPSDQQRNVLVFKGTGFQIMPTPLYPAGHNLITQSLNLDLKKDESVKGSKDIVAFGTYSQSQRYWLTFTPPQQVEEQIKQKIQEISIGAALEGYRIKDLDDLNKPVALSYDFAGPEYLTSAGPLRIMPQLSNIDTSAVAREKRTYPIDLQFLDAKQTQIRVRIPDGFKVKYLPENVNEDGPWFFFNVSYSFKDNTVFFDQVLNVKKPSIAKDEYKEFKKVIESLAKRIKQRVVLERIE